MSSFLNLLIFLFLVAALQVISPTVLGQDRSEDKVSESAKTVKKTVRKSIRKIEDKTCHLVNGQLNCAVKELKHKVENATDDGK